MKNSKYELDKLVNHTVIDTGFPFKSGNFSESTDDIPLVKGENLQQGYIDWAAAKYWPREDSHKYENYWLKPNDIVIAMDRPWVTAGLKWSYIKDYEPQSLLVQRVARLRAKGQLDQSFLRYLIGSQYFSNYVQPIVTGVNVPHISAKQIGGFPIPLPPVAIQIKIAAVLSAYDDLIENNNLRIALLEKMAEEIYREWFVRLRFPGHKQVARYKGIPEKWEIKELRNTSIDIIDGDRGKNYPKKSEFTSSGYCLFLNTGNLKNNKFDFSKNDFISKERDSLLRKGKVIANDIILTTRGTVGNIAFYSENLMYKNVRINSGMIIYRLKKAENSLFYYYLLKSPTLKEQYNLYSSGAAQPQLPIKDLKRIKVLLPPMELISKFCNLITPINNQLDKLQHANWNLAQVRDRLLPRLISGKLSVEDLDIQFPPSMGTD